MRHRWSWAIRRCPLLRSRLTGGACGSMRLLGCEGRSRRQCRSLRHRGHGAADPWFAPGAAARGQAVAKRAATPGPPAALACDDPQPAGAAQSGQATDAEAESALAETFQLSVPGDRVQMETCQDPTQPLPIHRHRRLQPSPGDWLGATPHLYWTGVFLGQVLDEMPFPIQHVQTDRGVEFFAERVQCRFRSRRI